MVASCYFNRLRGYSIIPSSKQDEGLLGNPNFDSRDDDSSSDSFDDDDHQLNLLATATTSKAHPPKKRRCCGAVIYTPNSSRYAKYWHSRFIQKFPFLVEMFYWAVNLGFYVSVKAFSELIFATDGVWKTAEQHGIAVLDFEQHGPLSFLFPMREVDVQTFFRTGHQGMLTILNRAYSMIHIPVTVRYLSLCSPSTTSLQLTRILLAFWPGTIMLHQPTPNSHQLAA